MPKLKKPRWGKPKLIVLIRGKPEEGVLLGCKSYWNYGLHAVADGCLLFDSRHAKCVVCEAYPAS